MMILLGNKQNSLILLGLFSFSRMEIPVYNLGECNPWGLSIFSFRVSRGRGSNSRLKNLGSNISENTLGF